MESNVLFDQDIKTLMFHFNQLLFKVKSDLDVSVKNFTLQKETSKAELKKTGKEVEKLKAEIQSFQDNIASQSTKTDIILSELSQFKTGVKSNVFSCNSLSYLNNQPANEQSEDFMDMKLSLKIFEHKLRSNDCDEINKGFAILKSEINENLEAMLAELSSQANSNKALLEKNKALREKFKELDEVNLKKRFCIHCQVYFIPKFNDEKSCFYHPGKLQYYSCRGCGDDEYYTCCSRCTKCSKGCKYSKHVSEITNN